jgi:hypothetical protein
MKVIGVHTGVGLPSLTNGLYRQPFIACSIV